MRVTPILLAALLIALPALLLAPPQARSQAASDRLRGDADQPIEINADNLDVQQDQNLAVFSGNVDATQGQIKLKADELRVWYRPSGQGGADVNGAIVRIDALGRVFVSSPEETAQGDQGIYDVQAKQITLTGKVVLTRGDNVIRGQSLVLDMTTGRSQVRGEGGRVRGYFVPEKKTR